MPLTVLMNVTSQVILKAYVCLCYKNDIKTNICFKVIQGDRNVPVQLTITVKSSGAQRVFDHPV